MATRDLATNFTDETDSNVFRYALLIEAEFSGGTLRLTTHNRDVVWNSNTYVGAGQMLSMTAVRETTEITAAGLDLTLSGIPSSLTDQIMDEIEYGTRVNIYMALFDNDWALITNTSPANPYKLYTGYIDIPIMEWGAEEIIITLKTENPLIILDQPLNRKYTSQDQALDYPNDRGFEFVTRLQKANIRWDP